MKSIHPILAALLALCASPFAEADATRSGARLRSLPSLMPAPDLALKHATEIDLTREQQDKLEAEVRDLAAEANRADAEVRRTSEVLAVMLSREPLDDAAVEEQFEKLLAAESAVKRLRLRMSLRTRAVLTSGQQEKLAALQSRRGQPRTAATTPERQELAAKMGRVRELIQAARERGRDLSNTREMWKRVNQATQEGNTSEACRILDETAQELESRLSAEPVKK